MENKPLREMEALFGKANAAILCVTQTDKNVGLTFSYEDLASETNLEMHDIETAVTELVMANTLIVNDNRIGANKNGYLFWILRDIVRRTKFPDLPGYLRGLLSPLPGIQ